MTIRSTTKKDSGYGSTQQQEQPVVVGGEYSEAAPLVGVRDEAFAEPVYRDVVWALLFLIHLAVMISLAIVYGSFGMEDTSTSATSDWKTQLSTELDDDEAIHQVEAFAEQVEAYVKVYPMRIFGFIIVPCVLLASIVSYVGTRFVIPTCPTAIVKFCLLGSIGWTIALTLLISISSRSIFAWIISAGVIGIVIYYVRIVWNLIPFAAVNLRVSLKAVSANWGMYIIAFLFSGIGFVWVFFWLYVTIGVLGHEQIAAITQQEPATTDVVDDDDAYYASQGDRPQQGITIFLLLVSLYWTNTVLLNTIQVTVAGVMGTWCFDKEDADSCCSPAVMSSLYRSMTYSFGSICFGSLVQALVTALRVIVENARQQQNNQNNQDCGALLLCVLDCILQCLEDIVEYFNQWAYCFVGIYGYSYLESGRKVIELFRARGWTAIISNSLVGYVLGFSMFTIAIVTGLLAIFIDSMVPSTHSLSKDESSYIFGPLPGHGYYAFGLGLIIGIVVSSVMMNVIKGAVNTLIVCYADAPAKLEENHPQTVRDLAETWSSVFPEVIIAPARAATY